MRHNTSTAVSYLLSDHPSTCDLRSSLRTSLGSTSVTANTSGANVTELRYYAYGGVRYNPGNQVTTDPSFHSGHTGQRWDSGTSLYYGARWYDPAIGRFTQADTIVPQPGNPGSLNRYSYVLNNPLRYIDPSGHRECEDVECTSGVYPQTGRTFRPHPPSPPRFWLATPPAPASIAPGGIYGEGAINWGGQQVSVYHPPSIYAYADGTYLRGSRCRRGQVCLDSFTIGDYWWGEDWGNSCLHPFQRQISPITQGTWKLLHTTSATAHAFNGRLSLNEYAAGIASGGRFEVESLPPTAEEIGTRAGQVAGAADALNVVGGALQGLATMTHDDSYYLQRNSAGAYRVIIISIYDVEGRPYYVTTSGRYPVGLILPP